MAYLARLIIHRYAMLGVLDEQGFPLRDMGVLRGAGPAAARCHAGAQARPVPCPDAATRP